MLDADHVGDREAGATPAMMPAVAIIASIRRALAVR